VVAVAIPHLLAASAINAASDFLDSTFAGMASTPVATQTPSPTPTPTPPPSPTPPGATASPGSSSSPTPSPSPTPEIGQFPSDGGNGTLPAFDAKVPWTRPGAQPWGDDGRFDLLLMGSDAGRDRWSRRTDVMLLIEVDVASGDVAMVGLPRNLQNAPYPPGPARDGSACGCQPGLLNEMYVEATARHPGRWPGTGAVKGIGAVRAVVSEITGRPIDAVLIVDLEGVIRVVDAMGGIDINVPEAVYDSHYPDPAKGSIELSIKAGQQHFDGRTALAYARSRHQDSDYGRMERQQVLLLAMRQQLGPATILSAPGLFGAAKGTAWTDLPRESLPALVELFARTADAKVKQLRIVPSHYPAWLTAAWVTQIRKDVAALLPGTPAPARSRYPLPVALPTPRPTPRPTAAPTSSPSVDPSAGPSASPDPTPAPPPSLEPTPAAPSPSG
jgi:LCP family protein required for cell wall assembly